MKNISALLMALVMPALFLAPSQAEGEQMRKVTVYKRDKNGKFVRQFEPGEKGDSIEGIIRQDHKDEEAVNDIHKRLKQLSGLYGDDSTLGRFDIPGRDQCLLSKLAYDDALKCMKEAQRRESAVAGSTRSTERKREITSSGTEAQDHEKASVDFAH